jgi:hypothetical protein
MYMGLFAQRGQFWRVWVREEEAGSSGGPVLGRVLVVALRWGVGIGVAWKAAEFGEGSMWLVCLSCE